MTSTLYSILKLVIVTQAKAFYYQSLIEKFFKSKDTDIYGSHYTSKTVIFRGNLHKDGNLTLCLQNVTV